MSKDITVQSPEFYALYEEINQRNEAIRKRDELSNTSFRNWLALEIEKLASQLGYHIQNLYEFTADMAASFAKGFEAGRNRAKAKAIRRQWNQY